MTNTQNPQTVSAKSPIGGTYSALATTVDDMIVKYLPASIVTLREACNEKFPSTEWASWDSVSGLLVVLAELTGPSDHVQHLPYEGCPVCTPTATAYTVSHRANDALDYATTNHDDAMTWAQKMADFDFATNSNGPTPHYVVTGWGDGIGTVHNSTTHVYAATR